MGLNEVEDLGLKAQKKRKDFWQLQPAPMAKRSYDLHARVRGRGLIFASVTGDHENIVLLIRQCHDEIIGERGDFVVWRRKRFREKCDLRQGLTPGVPPLCHAGDQSFYDLLVGVGNRQGPQLFW